jgi:hypothetical protein
MKRVTPQTILYPGVFALGIVVVFAQQASPDILSDLGSAWNNFISSGQMVAMFVGMALGYLIRMFTSY